MPASNLQNGINVLTKVPAFDWSYGCSATSAAMMMGYYDNNVDTQTCILDPQMEEYVH